MDLEAICKCILKFILAIFVTFGALLVLGACFFLLTETTLQLAKVLNQTEPLVIRTEGKQYFVVRN